MNAAMFEERLKTLNVTASGCWEWTGARERTGYGTIRVNGRRCIAHRVVYETIVAPVPSHLYVCHRCDNRLCVNPDHLFLGTPQDNARDRNTKGRAAPTGGEKNGKATITDAQAREMRALYAGGLQRSEIASRFGVSRQIVTRVCSGKTFRVSP